MLLTECYFCLMLTKLFAEILIYLSVLCRMSIEMVACITIEAISILEKMHSKGYFFVCLCFWWITNYVYMHINCNFWLMKLFYWLIYFLIMLLLSYVNLFPNSYISQLCSWRCKAWELLAWSSWHARREKTLPCWSWFR